MLKHKPEEYDVKVNIYNDEGKLVKEYTYSGVKQLVFKTSEVRVSRQLSIEPFTLVTYAEKPKVELREETLLYIVDEGSS